MPHCNKQMISFFLTTKCNLCCLYCYNLKERAKIEEQSVSYEIAKAGIDWYFANNESRHVRFYGPGEPTQEFMLMKDIVEYAKASPDRGKDVSAEIQTNGVFGEQVREWMLDNMNIIWMSFDGTKDIQDYYRPLNPEHEKDFGGRTSAEVLEENILWFNQNKGSRKLMVGARLTITEKNIDRQHEMAEYFYSLGIRYVWTNPLFSDVNEKPVCDDKEKRGRIGFDMDKYLDYYINTYNAFKGKGLFWGSFLAINFDGESPFHCRACTPTPHITPDGYLSACDMVLLGEKPYHMEPFIYGKWNPDTKKFDIYEEKMKALRERHIENMAHCKNCRVRLHCGGYCLGEVQNEVGNLLGQTPKICKAVIRLFDALGAPLNKYDFFHP